MLKININSPFLSDFKTMSTKHLLPKTLIWRRWLFVLTGIFPFNGPPFTSFKILILRELDRGENDVIAHFNRLIFNSVCDLRSLFSTQHRSFGPPDSQTRVLYY